MKRPFRPAWAVVLACAAALLGDVARAAPAGAQPSPQEQAALAHWKAGRQHYIDGRYGDAVAEMEQALDLFPSRTLLFNLAQAHRRNGSLERAVFLYKRYLIANPHAKDRAEVAARINELEAVLASRASGNAARPADGAAPAGAPSPSPAPGPPPVRSEPSPGDETNPGALPLASAGAGTTITLRPRAPAAPPLSDQLHEMDADELIADDAEPPAPRDTDRLRLLARTAVAFTHFTGKTSDGRLTLADRVLFTEMISATYAVPLAIGALDFGVATSWTPLAYLNPDSGDSKQSHLWGGFVTGELRLALGQGLSIGPGCALGAIWWAGLSTRNTLTSTGNGTDGAVPFPSVRFGLPFTWRTRDHLVLGIEPAWSYSSNSSLDLAPRIGNLTMFSVNAVIGLAL